MSRPDNDKGPELRLAATPAPPAAAGAGTENGPLAVQTAGLTKRYRRATALSDCSVTVSQGRISALVGPNGAGKSTLLRLLTGLARPTRGSALVLGGTPRQDPAFLAEIGYLAEHTVLVGPRKDTAAIERTHTVVHATQTTRQATLVIRRGGPVIDPAYQAEDISLEDLVLAYMGAAAPAAYAHLSTVGEDQ